MTSKRSGFTARTKARKRAADVLFEADQRRLGFSSTAILKLLEERKVITAAQTPLPEYSIEIVQGVAANLSKIDDLLRRHVKNRELTRLPSFDLSAMRIAVWEMLENSSHVPPVTAIDEAVAIVKRISTTESPTYVNAALDAIRKDILQQGSKESTESVGQGRSAQTESGVEPGILAGGQVKQGEQGETTDSVSSVDMPDFRASGIPSGLELEQEIEKIAVADLDDDLLDELLDEY